MGSKANWDAHPVELNQSLPGNVLGSPWEGRTFSISLRSPDVAGAAQLGEGRGQVKPSRATR